MIPPNRLLKQYLTLDETTENSMNHKTSLTSQGCGNFLPLFKCQPGPKTLYKGISIEISGFAEHRSQLCCFSMKAVIGSSEYMCVAGPCSRAISRPMTLEVSVVGHSARGTSWHPY